MKTVELPFGYYERGLDFAEHLEESETVSEALKSWADQVSEWVEKTRKLAEKLEGKYVETNKEEALPVITIEDKLADELLKEELVEEFDEIDYDREGFGEDEDYDEESEEFEESDDETEGEEEENFEEHDEDED
jgi:hypothetical protein